MFFRRLAFSLTAALLCTGLASANTYSGPAEAVGKGTVHAVVRTGPGNVPVSLSLVISKGALRGLPPNDKKDGEWSYLVSMPAGTKTGIDHITVDWNPHGHPPPEIYGLPHFDFHFYMVDVKDQLAVAFPKEDKDPAVRVTDKALIPPGYEVVPMTAVPQMGVHAVNPASPEFHGKRFTATFIYGYYKGRLIFLEPMITRAFLLSHPDVTYAVPTPKKYSFSGYYPTRYSVRYDAAHQTYVVELSGLKHFD